MSPQGSAARNGQLSVIVPLYNERATVEEVLRRVVATGLAKEVIVVDDGSADGSRDVVAAFAEDHPEVELICHETNRGKGGAVHTGIARATAPYTIIQDADLEYDPEDYAKLLAAAEEQDAEVVYGSRIRGGMPCAHVSFYLGGRLVSLVASLLYLQWITDEPTCYKLLRTELLKSLPLREQRFGFCPEVTALVRKRGKRIVEVPIAYHARRIEEGKKIRWTDGLEAIWILLKLRFRRAT